VARHIPKDRSGRPAEAPPALRAWTGSAITLSLLGLALALQYGPALRQPLLGDDYAILDRTRWASFAGLWSREHLFSHWYRPVSRELYYWTMQRLAGLEVAPWHLASFALWLAVMAGFVALGRRLAGEAAAVLAAACVAALASWGGPLFWVAGVQELWMLLFALAYLLAFADRRALAAPVLLALALLSKETAGVLPGVALAWALAVDRDRPRAALRRLAPSAAVVMAWLLFHPWLLPRLLGTQVEPVEAATRPGLLAVLLRTGLAPLNLEAWPAPVSGWGAALVRGLPGIAALLALGAWALWSAGRGEPAPRRRGVTAFLAAWAALGFLPLLVPTIGWHAYYGLFGSLGLWLLLARLLARRRPLALAALLALAVLRPLRADTPSWDWSSQAYFERAGTYIEALRADLLRRHPTLPPYSRLYFARVPQNIGLVVADGPAFRVWYGDSTLRAGFYSDYLPRPADAPAGRDYFFSCEVGSAWREVTKGPEPAGAGLRAGPQWEDDHRELALLLGSRGDWEGAAVELAKLAAARPGHREYAVNLAYCLERAGRGARPARRVEAGPAVPGTGFEPSAGERPATTSSSGSAPRYGRQAPGH
jgi:hypothetical protein